MYDKAIIFYTANYCLKVKNYFGVDYLLRNGVNVEFWDCSEITAHEHLTPIYSDGLVERNISSLRQFEELVRQNHSSHCLYMSFVDYLSYSAKLYRIMSKYNADMLLGSTGQTPDLGAEGLYTRKDVKINYTSVKRWLVNRINSKMLKTNLYIPLKYEMLSCLKTRLLYKTGPETIYLPSNSGDYENSLIDIPLPEDEELKGKFILFMDQNHPYHNDYKLLGFPQLEPEPYFKQMNEYFDKIEEKYKCPVVISAHPSAVKYKEFNPFNGRKLYFNLTLPLTKQCYGVITHNTTAVSFAVLYNKPIILVTMDGFGPYDNAFLQGLKNHLNTSVDNPRIADCTFPKVDKEKYDSYKYDYLTHPDANGKTNGQILLEILKMG